MKPLAKVGIVAGAYGLAFVMACVVVAVYVAATSGPDRQTYAAMYDFGDSLLFLGVLGVATVPGTAVALFFLRPVRSFWIVLPVVAVAIASTGLAAMLVHLAQQQVAAGSALHGWSALAVLRILVAPVFVLLFLVSALVAPSRGSRMALFAACAIEATAFSWIALLWLRPPG
jgi:hypothetical protein